MRDSTQCWLLRLHRKAEDFPRRKRSKSSAVNHGNHAAAASGSALRAGVCAEARARSSYLCGSPRGAEGRRGPSGQGSRPAAPPLSAVRRAPHVGRSPRIARPERRRHRNDQPALAEACKSRENEHLSASSLACLQISRGHGLASQRAEATSSPDEVGTAQSAGIPDIARVRMGLPLRTSSLRESIPDLRRVSSSQSREGRCEPCRDC